MVPGLIPDTLPLPFTEAIRLSVLLQEMLLLVALSGETAADSCSVSPVRSSMEEEFSVMLVTGIVVTVTVQLAETFPPSVEVTVITAVPGALAVIAPAELTDTTEGLLLSHEIASDEAAEGEIVTERADTAPVCKVRV